MKPSLPHVYVGIVTYNSAAILTRCVEALLKQTYVYTSIFIFDNSSTDRIQGVVKKFGKKVAFIKSVQNLGFGGGHNRIIRSVKMRNSDYYIALNPDAVLEPDCVGSLVEFCENKGADWATGKLYKDVKNKILYSVGHALLRDGYAYNIGYGCRDEGQYDEPREVFGAAGAAAMYKASMLRTVSFKGDFFDPKLFMYYEDVDVDWRARLLGLHCWFVPSARISHAGGIFPSGLEAEVMANRFLSVIKNAHWMDLVFYNLPVICLHTCGRLVVTPSVGIQIIRKLFGVGKHAFINRTKWQISRRVINSWFIRNAKEESNLPITMRQRVEAFFRRKLH